MADITNTPVKQLQDYTFDEIGSFSVDQLAGVPMERQFTPLTNTSRVSTGVTWDTWDVAWQDETRTWDELASLIDNTSFKSLGGYTFDEIGTFSLDQVGGVEFTRQFSPITNTPKT